LIRVALQDLLTSLGGYCVRSAKTCKQVPVLFVFVWQFVNKVVYCVAAAHVADAFIGWDKDKSVLVLYEHNDFVGKEKAEMNFEIGIDWIGLDFIMQNRVVLCHY
jgi:hypothetical protein